MGDNGCGHMSGEAVRRGSMDEGPMPTSRRLPATRAAHRKSTSTQSDSRPRRRGDVTNNWTAVTCALLAASFQTAAAQGCISLRQSSVCSAFNASSISTDSAVTGLFPFLSTVSNVQTFDSGLQAYIQDGYAQVK